MGVNFVHPFFMKNNKPGVKIMEFEDSHEETVYHVVYAFERKTDDIIEDFRVRTRRYFMRTIIFDAFSYNDGLLDDRIFRKNPKLVDKLAEEMYIILKQSLKDCSGAFCENPSHCADEYLRKHCKVLFKRIMAESDFVEGV